MSESPMNEAPEKIVRTEAEWRAQLTPEQYHVLREKGTERPFTGLLTENHETGNYHCAACGALLFLSGAKFDSGCGWPSFMLPAGSTPVEEHEDSSFGMRRIEVTCARCGGHLGHVFPDGPAHRPPLLHQLRLADLRAGGVSHRRRRATLFS